MNPYNVTNFKNKFIKISRITNLICKICGKNFKPIINKGGTVSKSSICDSEECKQILRHNSGIKAQKISAEKGTWKPW